MYNNNIQIKKSISLLLGGIYSNKNRLYNLFLLPIAFIIVFFFGAFAHATPVEMVIGVVPNDSHSGVMHILHAFRGAIFIALILLCSQALKMHSKIAFVQVSWLLSLAGLSIGGSGDERYIGVPDFSYFPVWAFCLCSINIFASADYLRRILTPPDDAQLFDNIILIVSVLCIAALTILSINMPILAADILLTLWSCVVIFGSLIALYYIVNKSNDSDLNLLGWVPAQIGLIVALGVGKNGGNIAIITSITAWSCVIIAHIFLAFLTYMRCLNYQQALQGRNNTSIPKNTLSDSVSMVVDKAVFRFKSDTQKIILNENCAKMLHISGRQSEFSIDAFKGLIAADYHYVIDMIMNNNLDKTEKIKFHSCREFGFIQPIKFSSNEPSNQSSNKQGAETGIDTVFIYQIADEVLFHSHVQAVDFKQQNLMPFVPQFERRQTSDMMNFINHAVNTVISDSYNAGSYVLLLFKIRFYEDWQAILGVSQSYHLTQQITTMINDSLQGFDALICKSFSGDNIGIFCHVVTADEEIERLKLIIHKRFEAPLNINDQNIFVSFFSGDSKAFACDFIKSDANDDIKKTIFTPIIAAMIDNAKREIHFNNHQDIFVHKTVSLPQGANILHLSSDLRYAPERSQINAYYAPIIDLTKGEVIGFNIEPIWRHPDFNVISGTLLNYVAHRCNMENTLNRLVIAKAIEGMVKLYRSHKMPVMSFQISRMRLLNTSLDEEIKGLCDVLKINPSLIRLEFAPDCLGDEPKWLANILSDLKIIGVTTVLGGFGSTQGQLASLANLAFDRVIIDSEFADDINNNERKFFALKSLTTMLNDMAIAVDIKNIQDKTCFKSLFNAGVSNISGDAVGGAMSAERAVNLLTKNYEVL